MGISYTSRWNIWGLNFNAWAPAIPKSILTQESYKQVDGVKGLITNIPVKTERLG